MSVNNKFYLSFLFSMVLNLITLAAPTVAQVSAQQADPTSYGMTSGRLVATGAAVVALIGVGFGGLALFRSTGRVGAIVALAAGLIGTAIGGMTVATAGGFGSGGGRAGAIAAVVLGLVALALGGLALARSRRAG